jgi:hypothetical protein
LPDGNFQKIIITGTHRFKDNIKIVILKVRVKIDSYPQDVTKSWAIITLQYGEILSEKFQIFEGRFCTLELRS